MSDPVTLAVVRGALEELVREMDDTLVSSAFSPILSEGHDCAHGLFEANGDLIVQGEFSLPVFVAALQSTCRHVVENWDTDDGDIILTNHPDRGGTHVQDMKLITPVFAGDRRVFYLGSTGHWLDIGGSIPGGWHPHSRSVFAEGLIVDGAKLVRRGELNEDVLRVILSNARVPVPLEGDINAHFAALEVGRTRLGDLIQRYGADLLLDVVAEMRTRSEIELRAKIRSLEDRTVRFEDIMDNDGIVDRPITVSCEMTVRGDSLVLDMTGSSDQSAGPINLPYPGTVTACLIALKHWWPEIPINAGCFRPLEVITRPGSVLSSTGQAPVAGYSELMQRVIDVVFGCLGQLDPEGAMGAAYSTTGGMSFSAETPDGLALGAWYLDGGYGGSSMGDGLQGATPIHSMALQPPVEVFEHRLPVRFLQRAVRPDSAGDGTNRGGCGTVYEIEFTAPSRLAFLGDRTRRGPFGVNGGASGQPAHWSFTIGGQGWDPPMGGKGDVDLAPGDRLLVLSPGGGGWGPPAMRDEERRDTDLREGYVTGE